MTLSDKGRLFQSVSYLQICVFAVYWASIPLLPNRWANLDQTWQKCSLGVLFKKLSTKFDPIKNSGFHGNEMEFFKQFFKNLLWNRRSDFEIISQECSLGDPFQILSAKFWSVYKMALVNGGFLHYRYGHTEILNKSSSPKPLVQFWNNFRDRKVPWMTLFKNCIRSFHASINMALVNGASCTIRRTWRNCWKVFSETACPILQYFHRNVFWVTLFKNC